MELAVELGGPSFNKHLTSHKSEDTAQMITNFLHELPYYYMSLRTEKPHRSIGYIGRKSAKYGHCGGGAVALNNTVRDSLITA